MRLLIVALLVLSGSMCLRADDLLPQGGDHPAIARYRHRPAKVVVSGTLLGDDGRSISNATIYVFGHQRQHCPFPTVPCLELGRGETDTRGAFSFESATMSDTNHQVCVIAPGFGARFLEIDPDEGAVKLGSIRLAKQQDVRGKIIDPEGKPAKDVLIEVRSFMMPGYKLNWFGSTNPGKVLRPIVAKTRADGSFEINGIPKEAEEIWIRIDDERYALYERGVQIGLRQQEGIIKLPATELPATQINLSRPIYVKGTVTRKDTGKPLAKAWVGVTFSDIEVAADSHVAAIWAQTDEQGRYRVRCGPWASRVHVYAFAPPNVPCPDWSVGPTPVSATATEIELPISMPLGTFIKGKVINQESGEPIANASYVHILRREEPRVLSRDDAYRMYWANEYHYRYSSEDGTFQIPVPAGESGVILVTAPDSTYVSQITSIGKILMGKHVPWWSVSAAVVNVSTPADGRELNDLTIQLRQGVTAKGSLVGPDGNRIDSAVVISSTPMHTHSHQQHGEEIWGRPVKNGKFEVVGLDPSTTNELYFLDAKNQLGATLRLSPQTDLGKDLVVRLERCGVAQARIVDSQGKPVTGPRSSDAIQISSGLEIGIVKADPSSRPFPTELFLGAPMLTLDPERYQELKADRNGLVKFQSLIPNAPYQWVTADPQGFFAGPPKSTSFSVKPGEIRDLGSFTAVGLDIPQAP